MRILFVYISQFLRTRLAMRADMAFETVGFVVTIAFQLLFLHMVLRRSGGLGDWTSAQAYFIFGAAMVPMGLFNLVSGNIYGFADKMVNQGGLDRLLLRPLGVLPQVFMESFRFGAMAEAALGVWLMTHMGAEFGWAWTPGSALLFTALSLCAFAIILSVFVCVMSASFWAQDKLGIDAPIWNLMTFGRYPLTVFRPFVQFLLLFILPFACIGFLPAAALMDVADLQGGSRPYLPLPPLVFIPLSALACSAVAGFVWNRGLRNYTSVGA